MKTAIEEAKKCEIDIPIGCVIKQNGIIITATHNQREKNNDITAHAEILAIRQAQKILSTSRLSDCELYVTLEPCPMCAWTILQARIKSVYFGSYNKQYGAMGTVLDLPELANSKIKIYGGIEEEYCDMILENFFFALRNKGKQ